MRWLIRWTDFRTFRDHELIVNADSREAAEAIASKRKIPVTYLGPADIEAPRDSLSCMGEPVGMPQVAALILCGVATIGVLLQAHGMLLLSNRIW